MAVILADDIFNCIFLNGNDRIPIQISLKYVLGSPVDHKPTLVQVMAWCRTGDKPLPGPMMTQFIDAYMRHYGEMRYLIYGLTSTSVKLTNHKKSGLDESTAKKFHKCHDS